jgi:hypothetical protein
MPENPVSAESPEFAANSYQLIDAANNRLRERGGGALRARQSGKQIVTSDPTGGAWTKKRPIISKASRPA